MANEEAKLFVAGLPDSISEDVLKQLFEATGGKVVSVSLPKDRMTGRPRGFGFVTLATPQEAQAARDALDGSMQAGKSISVRPFQAEPPRRDGAPGGPRGHLAAPGRWARRPRGRAARGAGARPHALRGQPALRRDAEEVQMLVNGGRPDSVVRVHLPMDADGRKRGFGFVTHGELRGGQDRGRRAPHGRPARARLVVNLAHPKGERPARPDGGGGFGGSGSVPAVVRRRAPARQRGTRPTSTGFEEKRASARSKTAAARAPGAARRPRSGAAPTSSPTATTTTTKAALASPCDP